MFDRETRREKVLEGLAKEARIQAASAARQGMKSVVTSVNIQSRLTRHGFEKIKEKVHGKTKKEELVEKLVLQAERNFFSTLKAVREERSAAGKPLHYSVPECEEHITEDE